MVHQLERKGLVYSSLRFDKFSFGIRNSEIWGDFGGERASNSEYRDFCPEEARKATDNSQQVSVK